MLQTKYARNDATKRLLMMKMWGEYQWGPAMDIDSFLAGIYLMVSSCETAGCPKSEEEIFTKILQSLPGDYSTEISIMQTWDVPNLDQVWNILMSRQDTIKRITDMQGHAPAIGGTAFPMIDNKKKKNHKRKRFECFYCGKEGHRKWECRSRKADVEKGVIRDIIPGKGKP